MARTPLNASPEAPPSAHPKTRQGPRQTGALQSVSSSGLLSGGFQARRLQLSNCYIHNSALLKFSLYQRINLDSIPKTDYTLIRFRKRLLSLKIQHPSGELLSAFLRLSSMYPRANRTIKKVFSSSLLMYYQATLPNLSPTYNYNHGARKVNTKTQP